MPMSDRIKLQILEIEQDALSLIDGIEFLVEELSTTPDGGYRDDLVKRRSEMITNLKSLKEKQQRLEIIGG